MSIQDPTPDPRQTPYGQQTHGAQAAGYTPVSDPAAQQPGSTVPPADPFQAGYPIPPYPVAPGPYPPGAPNPGLAALLGFIPGVGAMYNGQFPKGLAHIAIFAVFSSLSKHVNGIFGLFVAGWVFYMVLEAYQTARARREGLPLPDPFSLNNIGERFGFRGNPDFSSFWGGMGGGHGASAPPVTETSRVDAEGRVHYSRTDATGAQTTYQVDPAGNVYSTAASGFKPPSPPPPAGYPPYGAPPPPMGFGSPEYAAGTYANAPYTPNTPYPFDATYSPMPPMPPVSRNGLPSGAIWLIGLGFFALLGSMRSFAFLDGEPTGGLFLIGLSVFLFWRRFAVSRAMYPAGSPAARWNLIRESRGAAIVGVIGLLTLLQGLHVVNWENSWPFLLIFLGLFLLVERLAMNGISAAAPAAYPSAAYPGSPVPQEPVVETSSPTSIVPKYTRPGNDLNEKEGR